ncbi:hypothetical protein SASPL_140958 [Salvia splendens]|uniref:Uncharacterized protein n=1 Tax=Salvia splendens TaxID=180675 RepID=A0A8X8ZBU5_SALSN|nr:hypothetical protein SASPL_140958 [Salvia splendens]
MMAAMHEASRLGEAVGLPEMLVYATANMIGQVILSRRVFVTKGKEMNEFKEMVVELMTTAGYFNIGDFIPWLAWMDLQGIERGMKKLHKKWDRLIESKHPKKGSPRDGQSHRERAAFARIRHPKSAIPQSRMQRGIPKTPFHATKPASDLHGCMRRRWLPHPQEHKVERQHLVNIWAIGRDPDVWENPLDFNPDSFMSGLQGIEPGGNHFELIPFGAGIVIVEYFLVTLVHSFEWDLPAGSAEMDMEEVFGLALQKAVPLAARLTPRFPSHCYAPPYI